MELPLTKWTELTMGRKLHIHIHDCDFPPQYGRIYGPSGTDSRDAAGQWEVEYVHSDKTGNRQSKVVQFPSRPRAEQFFESCRGDNSCTDIVLYSPDGRVVKTADAAVWKHRALWDRIRDLVEAGKYKEARASLSSVKPADLDGEDFNAFKQFEKVLARFKDSDVIGTVRSIMPVQKGNEWVVRIRLKEGREIFLGAGAKYTMHQAQALASNSRIREGQELTARDLSIYSRDAASRGYTFEETGDALGCGCPKCTARKVAMV